MLTRGWGKEESSRDVGNWNAVRADLSKKVEFGRFSTHTKEEEEIVMHHV